MAKTLLKDDGVYVHEDFLNGKAVLRLAELNAKVPAMRIRRESNKSTSEVVLVSKDWWDTQVAAYAAVDAATFAFNAELKADDYLGRSLNMMVDLITGKVQVAALAKKVAAEGLTLKNLKVFSFMDTKAYYVDDSDVVAREPSTIKHGVIKGYLMHPKHYAALAATPVAGSYAGTGDGTLDLKLRNGGAIAETITLLATSATTFSVTGSVTGLMGTATVGTLFESPQLSALITAGATPFIAGDQFVRTSVVF